MAEAGVTLIATIPVPKGRPIPLVEELRNGANSIVFEVIFFSGYFIITEILIKL